MGQISEHTGLLRILLADEDDANAFLFQCGVNRLGRPCAFQRVGQQSLLPEKIAAFRPDILIAAGSFARPDQLNQIKQFTNGHSIICAVETFADGEAALEAGAADCVLKSQVDELHACIEWRLDPQNKVPYFKKDIVRKEVENTPRSPSKLDLKLAEFDRRVGALLRRIATAGNIKARKLLRLARVAITAGARKVRRSYRELKVKRLLLRQRRIVEANLAGASGSVQPSPGNPAPRQGVELPPADKARVLSAPPPAHAIPYSIPESSSQTENFDGDTLRTLELSFKTLFHTSLDPTFLLDGLGSFLHANAPACALLKLTPADLLGKTLLEFVPLSERAQVSALWEALLIEGQQKADIHLQTAPGENRDVFISARSNLWFGVHLLVVRDQTELKSLRAAVRSQSTPPAITKPPPVPAAPVSHPGKSIPVP